MFSVLFGFVTSFILVLFFTPSLIKVAELKNLLDVPNERKIHHHSIPSIGGILIFGATLLSYALWFPNEIAGTSKFLMFNFKYILACMLILFFIGIKDDIIGTAPIKKLVGQIIIALIMVFMANIKLTGMHGLFGLTDVPQWATIFISLFAYIVIINAFNLVDGIDGLAAGIGLICSIAFGTWFYLAGDMAFATLAYGLAGSLLAFLIFNFYPAQIFMGDSGSLIIGLICAILAMRMIDYDTRSVPLDIDLPASPIFALAVLVYPLYDTLRIFVYRAIKGVSPFHADKRHIHHRLLKIGLTQRQTVLTLYGFNIFIISVSILVSPLDVNLNLLISGGITLLVAQIPFFFARRHPESPDQNNYHHSRFSVPDGRAGMDQPMIITKKDVEISQS